MISIVTAERATEIIDNLPSHPGLIIKTLCLYRQGASFSVHGPRHSFGCLYAIPRGWEKRITNDHYNLFVVLFVILESGRQIKTVEQCGNWNVRELVLRFQRARRGAVGVVRRLDW